MTTKEQFDIEKGLFDAAREQVRHEDGLVNNRATWFLVLQGFLFTAFLNGVPLLEKFRGNGALVFCVAAGLTLLGAIGIFSGVAIFNEGRIAYIQISRVETWWNCTSLKDKFPPLRGGLGSRWYEKIFAGRMPFVFVFVWVLLIVLMIAGVRAG